MKYRVMIVLCLIHYTEIFLYPSRIITSVRPFYIAAGSGVLAAIPFCYDWRSTRFNSVYCI